MEKHFLSRFPIRFSDIERFDEGQGPKGKVIRNAGARARRSWDGCRAVVYILKRGVKLHFNRADGNCY